MHIYSLEHDHKDEPVYIATWLEKYNYSLNRVLLYNGDPFPDPDQVDFLIIMGGLMNIYEENDYPWLIYEKVFIRAVIDSGVPVLGVCLGGQLISSALGGNVTRADIPEFGWHTVRHVPINDELLLQEVNVSGQPVFPDEITVFQWHYDTFSIPPGAVHLYSSDACKNQAYIYNSRVIGLQFHPEMDITTIREFMSLSKEKMTEDGLLEVHDNILSRIQLFSYGNEFVSGLLHYLIGIASNKS